jgi:predicted negative regulator of RcsB-dependent stress response
VELYESDDPQFAAIKKWLKESGGAIATGLIIGIAVILGWNAWKSYQLAQASEASDLFQELLKATESSNHDSIVKLGEQIKTDYPDSPYADFAGLFLAKRHVETGNLEAARQQLETVMAESSEPSLKNIARLRLLRILLAEGKSQEALDLINGFNIAGSGKFESAYEELKGDAYVAVGKEREARSAYKRASELGRKSNFLDLKIGDLPAPSAPELPQQ